MRLFFAGVLKYVSGALALILVLLGSNFVRSENVGPGLLMMSPLFLLLLVSLFYWWRLSATCPNCGGRGTLKLVGINMEPRSTYTKENLSGTGMNTFEVGVRNTQRICSQCNFQTTRSAHYERQL